MKSLGTEKEEVDKVDKVSWCSWLSQHFHVVWVPGSNPGGTIFLKDKKELAWCGCGSDFF